MLKCFVCASGFDTNKLLLQHIVRLHPLLNKFRCSESSCGRTFSLINSYRKHRYSVHELNSSVKDADGSKSATLQEVVANVNIDVAEPEQNNVASLDSDHTSNDDSSTTGMENDFDSIRWHDSLQTNKNIEPHNDKFNLSYHDYSNALQTDVANAIAKLYNFSDMPRNRVQDIIDIIINLLNGSAVSIFEDKIMHRLQQLGESREGLFQFVQMFDRLKDLFKDLETEKKRFKFFKLNGSLVYPEQIIIGERDEFRTKDGHQELIRVPVSAEFIPMRGVLTKFFTIPGVYDKTIKYIDYLESHIDICMNFIQGEFWRAKKMVFGSKTVFPLIMYFDDYENNNPLGSHAGIAKCGAVYLSLPCLPPDYQSKLENTFLFTLFNSLDRKVFKNHVIFKRIIEELNFLSTSGINIQLPDGEKKIYFQLALIVGDNLGMHSMLGFVESFSALRPCRFCLINRNDINTTFHESFCTLRDKINYEHLLKYNDVKISGLKEPCCFHEIKGYHVTENVAVDAMHDLTEGICQYDLGQVLNYYVYEIKIFSLDHLNARIRGFQYGNNDKRNKPPCIDEHRLKNKCLSMSSAEMLCLIRNLSLIIGDMVPKKNPHWQLIILLKKIIEIIMADVYVVPGHVELLDTLIEEYLSLLSQLFHNSLKPKHHFLIHYPRIMHLMGPLWKLSSMRYESKHREGKITSRVSNSRVNVCHTIALKHQLKMNHRYMSKDNSYPLIEIGPSIEKSVESFPDLKCFSARLPNNIFIANWVVHKGKQLVNGTILVLPSSNPKFYMIEHIILAADCEICITAKRFRTVRYDPHFESFEVNNLEDGKTKLLTFKVLTLCVPTFIVRLPTGKYYIAKKWI